MKKYFLLTVLSLSFTLVSYTQEVDKDAVRDCFTNYKNAILNDQGEKAVDFVDQHTLWYYSEILKSSKTADSTTVAGMDILDKMMVLSIRYRTSKKDILSFDGKKLLVYAIQKGMVGKNSVATISIGDVVLKDKEASGVMLSNGEPTPISMKFYKEQGNWKVDLTSIFDIGAYAFESMVESSGQEEHPYLINLLKMITKKEPLNDPWQPIQ